MTGSGEHRRRVLFLMRSPAYVRNFESVLRELGARGHQVTVLFEERKEGADEAGLALVERMAGQHGSLSHEVLAPRPRGLRGTLRQVLTGGQDYLRYFEEPYREPGRLRARALDPLPPWVDRVVAAALRHVPRVRRALARAARWIHGRLGDDPGVVGELARRRPEALVVSPLVQLLSRQADWVRAARGLGIPSMLCVYSWDNLTNKGLMHAHPDRIAVWNDSQREEAVRLHGAAEASVVVTGAWPYDHWFGWPASRSRDELCEQLGLSVGQAMILYVCSSRFIAEEERSAVGRWVSALRSAGDSRVETANVIVRPHPWNDAEWREQPPLDLPGVVVFPPAGEEPVDASSRADYFDSIAHADAVVGVNTSALLESTIIGRPALALPGPEFRSSQEELPHFRELARILKVASSMDEHIAQLGSALADRDAEAAARRRFVEAFVRPRGGSPTPAERVAETIEDLLEVPSLRATAA